MYKLVVTVVCLFFALPVVAQDDKDYWPQGVTVGLKAKISYAPQNWVVWEAGNIPVSLKTVQQERYVFPDTRPLSWRPRFLFPVNVGPSVNFFNRVEISSGISAGFMDNGKDRYQRGCYCEGDTVTYMHYSVQQHLLGGYADAAVRFKGNAWAIAELGVYPKWMGIRVRHGHSEYNRDSTYDVKDFAGFRIPAVALVGLKYKTGYEEDTKSIGFSVMGGMAKWQFRVRDEYSGVAYSPRKNTFVLQFGVEMDIFKIRKKN